MKEPEDKKKKKYTVFVFIILAAIIIFLVLAGLQTFSPSKKSKGSISVSFDDKSIKSGKSTYMSIGAKNEGKTSLIGSFNIKIDNPDEVKINYPSQELLKFELMPGESIERRINITGTSKAYKTYYKLVVSIDSLEDDNLTFAKKEAILIVTND